MFQSLEIRYSRFRVYLFGNDASEFDIVRHFRDFLTSFCKMHVTMQLHLHPKTSLKLGQCWDRMSPKSKIYYICSVALPPHLVPAAPLLPRHCCRPSCRICVASADRLCHRACSCLKPLACGLLPKHARRSRRRLCAAGCSTQADWAGGLRSRG